MHASLIYRPQPGGHAGHGRGRGCVKSHLQPDPQLLSTGLRDAWDGISADDVHLVVERTMVAMAVVVVVVVVVVWLQR
jgi:hypothetical protein